jgi:hypothetical protein
MIRRSKTDSINGYAPSNCRTKGRLVVPPAFVLFGAVTGAARFSYDSLQEGSGFAIPTNNLYEINCPQE